MPEITARQQDLLFAAIAEYIRTGAPVSSEDLRKRYRLRYSPATIRNELLELTNQGLLIQPHTSAGRIPTDEGYRWYANKVSQSSVLEKRETEVLRGLSSQMEDMDEFFRVSTEAFSRIAHALVIGGALGDTESLYKSGFSEILTGPEFIDESLRNSFGALIDSIDEGVRALTLNHDLSEPHVFIGRENPIKEARPYSMIIKTIKRDDVFGVMAILGSKRMRYDKGLSLLNAVSEIFEDNTM